jgi:hypothetical protein
MTDALAKPTRPAPIPWTGTYRLERDGVPLGEVGLTKRWTPSGPIYTATAQNVAASGTDPGWVLCQALARLAPGEPVWPWFAGCTPSGLRLRALHTPGPWDHETGPVTHTDERPAGTNREALHTL